VINATDPSGLIAEKPDWWNQCGSDITNADSYRNRYAVVGKLDELLGTDSQASSFFTVIPLASLLAPSLTPDSASATLPLISAIDFGVRGFLDAWYHPSDHKAGVLWTTIQEAIGGYEYGRGTALSIRKLGLPTPRNKLTPGQIAAASLAVFHESNENQHGSVYNMMAAWAAFNLAATGENGVQLLHNWNRRTAAWRARRTSRPDQTIDWADVATYHALSEARTLMDKHKGTRTINSNTTADFHADYATLFVVVHKLLDATR
jgi:hypothetical protein